MKDGIAFDSDVEKRFIEKTGMSEAEARANIRYIKNRLKEFMNEETTHSVRLNGLCTINENYMMMKWRSYQGINPRFKDYLLRKVDSIKRMLENADTDSTIHYIRRPPFLYRRKYKMTDKELEDKQNEQE